MFDITRKIFSIRSSIFGRTELSEKDVERLLKELRLALIDFDMDLGSVDHIVGGLKQKISSQPTGGEAFSKILWSEIYSLISYEKKVSFGKRILLCGPHGSGKTTQSAKLSRWLVKKGRSPVLVSLDESRPAAFEQLSKLADMADIEVYSYKDIPDLSNRDLIFDSGGVTDPSSLSSLVSSIKPDMKLLVMSSSSGRAAGSIASSFDKALGITGVIATMMDGNAKAGALLSISHALRKTPILFEGIGEKIDDLKSFDAKHVTDRILGMEDAQSLIKEVEGRLSSVDKEVIKKKIKYTNITYVDCLDYFKKFNSMGLVKKIISIFPGLNIDFDELESSVNQLEVIVNSMTVAEKECKVKLDLSRKLRISFGSGLPIRDINHSVKRFKEMRQMVKNFDKLKKKMGHFVGFNNLSNFN